MSSACGLCDAPAWCLMFRRLASQCIRQEVNSLRIKMTLRTLKMIRCFAKSNSLNILGEVGVHVRLPPRIVAFCTRLVRPKNLPTQETQTPMLHNKKKQHIQKAIVNTC